MAYETTFFWLILTAAFVVTVLGGVILNRRGKQLVLRSIPGYRAMPSAVEQSIESDRPLHLSLGASAVGQSGTLAAIAGTNVIFALVERQAFTRRIPLISLTDPVSLAVTQDTLRKAYLARQNLAAYRSNAVAWFPQGARSLAFAAGASSLAHSMNVSSAILVGEFGQELAFIGEAGVRHRQYLIGASTDLEGQAVAYAQSDVLLIGEELFVGGAYLEPRNATYQGGVIALDVLRWLVVIAIIIAALVR
jgi:hypothetical protein